MPDITMCGNETCRRARECRRNPLSGTKPTLYRQPWFMVQDDKEGTPCIYFWPVQAQEGEGFWPVQAQEGEG